MSKSTFEEVYKAITKLVDRYAIDGDWPRYKADFERTLKTHGWTRQEYNNMMSAGDDY